jgi:hypothetical protein
MEICHEKYTCHKIYPAPLDNTSENRRSVAACTRCSVTFAFQTKENLLEPGEIGSVLASPCQSFALAVFELDKRRNASPGRALSKSIGERSDIFSFLLSAT